MEVSDPSLPALPFQSVSPWILIQLGAFCLDSLLCQADCLVFDLSTLFFYLDPLIFSCFVIYVSAFSFIRFKAAEAALFLDNKRRSM